MAYTAFIGLWDDANNEPDDDEPYTMERGLEWDAARDLLLRRLQVFEDDSCDDCRQAAAEAIQRLRTMAPGRFVDGVDGATFMIFADAG